MQCGLVLIINIIENGMVYIFFEVVVIIVVVCEYGLLIYMDGVWFFNVLVLIGVMFVEMIWKVGIDVVIFGGIKNGLMGVEVVVLFDFKKVWEFELCCKWGGYLFLKYCYFVVQMEVYLIDDLWCDLVIYVNVMVICFS